MSGTEVRSAVATQVHTQGACPARRRRLHCPAGYRSARPHLSSMHPALTPRATAAHLISRLPLRLPSTHRHLSPAIRSQPARAPLVRGLFPPGRRPVSRRNAGAGHRGAAWSRGSDEVVVKGARSVTRVRGAGGPGVVARPPAGARLPLPCHSARPACTLPAALTCGDRASGRACVLCRAAAVHSGAASRRYSPAVPRRPISPCPPP